MLPERLRHDGVVRVVALEVHEHSACARRGSQAHETHRSTARRRARIAAVTLIAHAPAARGDGNIVAQVKGGKLALVGDELDNAVVIDQAGLAADQLRATPTGATTLNGGGAPGVFGGIDKGIAADLGAGADLLRIEAAIVPGAVVVDGGDGNDTVDLVGAGVTGKTKLDLGDGGNTTTLDDFTSLGDKVDIRGRDDADTVVADDDSIIQGDIKLKLGRGTNTVVIDDSGVVGKLDAKGADGTDVRVSTNGGTCPAR